MWGALLAVGLAVAWPPSDSHRVRTAHLVESELATALKPIAAAYRAATTLATPSVESVRARIKAVRALEAAARPLFSDRQANTAAHAALEVAWTQLGDLESALAKTGEGKDAVTRAAVRAEAQARASDAYTIARFEAPRSPAPIANVLRTRMPALQACWQEHLLGRAKSDSIDVTATLTLVSGHVISVQFSPALERTRAHLGECLQTRLLGWAVIDGADSAELPLYFIAKKH